MFRKRIVLGVFWIFLAFGNLFRFIEHGLFSDHLLVTEGVLYLVMWGSLSSLSLKAINTAMTLSCCMVLSFLYGCFIHGHDLMATLYLFRSLGLLWACFILPAVCYAYFQGSMKKLALFLCSAYSVALCLGALLHLLFPMAQYLWLFLRDWNIGFQGDPHQGRFVSVYLDPNYYACIAVMGVLLGIYLNAIYRNKITFLYTILMLGSCLSTGSRSGLLVLFFSLLRSTWKWVGLCALCIFICLDYSSFMTLWQRTLYLGDDPSALCRLETFSFGFSLWKEHPCFGIGFCFLPSYTEELFGLKSVDASWLAILVQFGAIPSLVMGLWLMWKGYLWWQARKYAQGFYRLFAFYALLIIGFASQWNNVLFYPFWLLPFVLTASFLYQNTLLQKNKVTFATI